MSAGQRFERYMAHLAEGKARSAMRGYKGGTRAMLRKLVRMLREEAVVLKSSKQGG